MATVPELGVALALAVVAVVPLLRLWKGPRLPVSDYVRIALAPSLGFGLWVMALPNDQAAGLVVVLYASIIIPTQRCGTVGFLRLQAEEDVKLALSPFLGLEAFRLDRYGEFGDWFVGVLSGTALRRVGTPGERVFDLLAEVCLAMIVFSIAGTLSLVFRDAITPVSATIATGMFPAIAAVTFRLVLLPFCAPEAIIGRLRSW